MQIAALTKQSVGNFPRIRIKENTWISTHVEIVWESCGQRGYRFWEENHTWVDTGNRQRWRKRRN
jgi:hypothetical protein